tara:strand:- start:227 stop:367 length:141 start_codon:yes stop_codon:yes gene_type:complete
MSPPTTSTKARKETEAQNRQPRFFFGFVEVSLMADRLDQTNDPISR